MKILDKLQNPFALVAEGFVAGAILFYTTIPAEPELPQPAPTAAAAPAEEIPNA